MYNKTVLDNGLKIITEHQPLSRLVSVGIWVDVGSRDEHDLNNGCAHFVEHMLFKGTRHRSAQQIAQEFDVLGGAANAFTSRDGTCYYATVLDSHLPQLVNLLADIFMNSRFAEEDIKRERQVILQEINMVEDTPDDHIHDLFASQIWGRHPLGNTVLGNRGVITAANNQKLTDYVARHYQPGQIIISGAGNIEHEAFVKLWRDLERLENSSNRQPERLQPAKIAPSRMIYRRPQEQVHVLLGTYGLAANDPRRYAYLLLNILLGGNMSSRLFQEIREKHGLVYSIYSDISSYQDCGYIYIYLGVDKSRMPEALGLTLREIRRLPAEPLSGSDLANAREYVKAGLFLTAENLESIMMRLVRNELTFNRNISLDEVASEIDQVQAAELEGLATEIFGQAELTMAALGPLAEEEIDLGAF